MATSAMRASKPRIFALSDVRLLSSAASISWTYRSYFASCAAFRSTSTTFTFGSGSFNPTSSAVLNSP